MTIRNHLGSTPDRPCASKIGDIIGQGADVCLWPDVKSWAHELQKRRWRAFRFLNALGVPKEQWTPSAIALSQWADSPEVRQYASLYDDMFGITTMDYSEAVAVIIPLIQEGDALLAEANAPLAGGVEGEHGTTRPTIPGQLKSAALIAGAVWLWKEYGR